MAKQDDIVIFSIFHRGNWLAAELSQAGYKVSLVDLSSLYPRWTPSDWEGPFGIFESKDLLESQRFFLFEGESVVQSINGYCIWSQEGPIEWRGPLSKLQMQKFDKHKIVENYFRDLSKSSSVSSDVKAKVQKQSFREVWPVYLAHQIASLHSSERSQTLNLQQPQPFLSSYSHRIASRLGLEESLATCENYGVRVFKDCNISDITRQGKSIKEVEVSQSGKNTIIQAKHWLSMLSSYELSLLSDKVQECLGIQNTVEPDWSWVRYELEVEDAEELKVLPYQFVLINDPMQPWYGTNLMILNRTMKENQFDVWLKIPNAQRFQKQYLEETKTDLLQEFFYRMPMFRMKKIIMPQEYHYGFTDLGPARFNEYSGDKITDLKKSKLQNLMWSGPEEWQSQDWLSVMKTSQDLLQNINESLKK